METSDDPLINPPTIDKSVNAPREIFTDPGLLEGERKKKRNRAARTVLTKDFDAPILGNTGVLGLSDEVT